MKTEKQMLKEIQNAIDFAERDELVDLWNWLFTPGGQPKIVMEEVEWTWGIKQKVESKKQGT